MIYPGHDPHPLHPPGWAPPRGYTDGVLASGRLIVLSGQVGWNPATNEFESDDFAEQAAQALRNIVALLDVAGATPRQLVRLTWYITDRLTYMSARRDIGRHYRAIMGPHYPPMSVLIVAGLLEERALVEIEATAVLPA